VNLGMLRGFGGSVRGYRRGPVSGALASYTTVASLHLVSQSAAAATVLSGTTAASTATLQRALRVTGRGCINFAAIYANDGTARDVRMVIWIDGRRFVNKTATGIASTNNGFIAIGTNSGSFGASFQPIEFQRELLVQYGCSVAETGKLTIAYNVETWAP